MKLRSILVVASAPFTAHIGNAGEKLLGNFTSIKRLPGGEVYFSGQKQRHAFFASLTEINRHDPDRDKTWVSNADGISDDLANDLRADLGGYMRPRGEAYLGKRVSPVSATFAIAKEPSRVFVDLLQRKTDRDTTEMAIAQREVSERDEMVYAFHLDVDAVGTRHTDTYDKDGIHLRKNHYAFISKEEKLRRVKLFVEATRRLLAYSHSARNANSGEPSEVYIVLDTVNSRKATRLLDPKTSPQAKKNLLCELAARGAKVFHGDEESVVDDKTPGNEESPTKVNTSGDGEIPVTSVAQAYQGALQALAEKDLDVWHPEGKVVGQDEFRKKVDEALLAYASAKREKKKTSKDEPEPTPGNGEGDEEAV